MILLRIPSGILLAIHLGIHPGLPSRICPQIPPEIAPRNLLRIPTRIFPRISTGNPPGILLRIPRRISPLIAPGIYFRIPSGLPYGTFSGILPVIPIKVHPSKDSSRNSSTDCIQHSFKNNSAEFFQVFLPGLLQR